MAVQIESHADLGVAGWADQLDRSRRRLHDAERAVGRIPEIETAIARRSDWLLSHPAELAWESDLATRLAQRSNEPERTAPGHDHADPDHDLEALLPSVDLRTIDLSAHLPEPASSNARAARPSAFPTVGKELTSPSRPSPATASTVPTSAFEFARLPASSPWPPDTAPRLLQLSLPTMPR